MLYFLIIIICIIALHHFLRKKNVNHFESPQRHWFITGLSLFAVQFSITSPLLFSGIFHGEGLQGMWFLWAQFLIAGLVPFVFAPLWIKLNITTDNEFVMKRFSGKAASYLQLFRAVYVGLIICSLMLAFQVLAFVKFMQLFSNWSTVAIYVTLIFSCIVLSFYNHFRSNLIVESLQAVLLFVCCAILLFYLDFNFGIDDSIIQLKSLHPQQITLFPKLSSSFFIFVVIQAFSVHMFDGSGVEAQRFFSNKSTKHVWKISVTSSILITVFNFFIFLILMVGWAQYPSPGSIDTESLLLFYLQQFSNGPMQAIIVVLFSLVFVSSFSGYLNWGASYLSVDVYQKYLKKKIGLSDSIVNFLIILLISILSILVAYFSEALDFIIKLLFNLSAGVAPVFVLRWFWMRINAWSQISAMLSGVVYAALYYLLLDGTEWERNLAQYLACSNYAVKLYTLTLLTTATWLLVTYLSPIDNEAQIRLFKQTVTQGFNLKKGLLHAISFGLLMLLFMLLLFKIVL